MAQYHVILSLAKGGAWDGAPRQKEPSQDVLNSELGKISLAISSWMIMKLVDKFKFY